MKLVDLFEGRDAPLYHATSIEKADQILISDIILDKTSQLNWKLFPQHHKKHDLENHLITGVSLTRDFHLAKTWQTVIFALDQRKLNQTYKLIPINYHFKDTYHEQSSFEMEEFCIGPIRNLSKYLTDILIVMHKFD